MNTYLKLEEKHRKMVNEFSMAFAFNDAQFAEAKEKLNVKSNNELLRVPAGGFIRKSDREKYYKMLSSMVEEQEKAMKNDEYVYQGFLYELGNHEYCVTGDPTNVLSCFGLTFEKLQADKRLLDLFQKAKEKYLSNVNW